MDYVSRLSDLDYLRVEKTGDDGWCVKQLFLIINGRTIYSKTFSGNGLWLDNSGGQSRVFYIDDSEMRTTADWTNFFSPYRPSVISVADMRARMEGAFGDFVAYDHLINDDDMLMQKDDNDGGYGIDFYPITSNNWRVDLDAEADVFGPNYQVDVDFDLKAVCSNGRVVFSTASISPTVDYASNSPTGKVQNFARNTMAARLNEMMKNFTAYQNNCYYMNIYLSSNGDLNIKEQNIPVNARGSEKASPINIQTPLQSEVAPYEETSFTAAINSELSTDTEAEISFDLSSGILPLDAVIEAREGKKTRRITIQEITKQLDGSSRIIVRDRLRVGKNIEYTLRLIFQPQDNQAEQIVTGVKTIDGNAVVESSSIQTITDFIFGSSKIKLQ